MAAAKIYRVVTPFVLYRNGVREHYNLGPEIYAADHHAVKANPGGFVITEIRGVEQATAAPGEKREAALPVKKAAKK